MTFAPSLKCDCLPWPDVVGGQVVSIHQDSCALYQDPYYVERQYEFQRSRELEAVALKKLLEEEQHE